MSSAKNAQCSPYKIHLQELVRHIDPKNESSEFNQRLARHVRCLDSAIEIERQELLQKLEAFSDQLRNISTQPTPDNLRAYEKKIAALRDREDDLIAKLDTAKQV